MCGWEGGCMGGKIGRRVVVWMLATLDVRMGGCLCELKNIA